MIRVKLSSNYQSIELELDDLSSEGSKNLINSAVVMINDIGRCVNNTATINRPQNGPLASEKQRQLMDRLHIVWTNNTTMQEARNMIDAAIKHATSAEESYAKGELPF